MGPHAGSCALTAFSLLVSLVKIIYSLYRVVVKSRDDARRWRSRLLKVVMRLAVVGRCEC